MWNCCLGASLRRFCLVLLVLPVIVTGCAREPDPVYVTGPEIKKLGASHQQQIADALLRMFGTPLNPRLLVPSDETSDDEEAEVALVDAIDPDHLRYGATIFNRRCAGCHGVSGDGQGEAAPYLQPKPRDYRRGVFKFTSTPYGAKPTRSDLLRIIRYGAKGTSMPAFPWLAQEDVQAVVDYVVMLSHRGEVEQYVAQVVEFDYEEEDPIEFFEFTDGVERAHESWREADSQIVMPATVQPRYSDETILAGRRAFLSRGCSKCHGEDGRGQTEWLSSEFLAQQESAAEGEKLQINYDAWGNVAPAADLSAGMLHGGRRSIDIFRRIHTGINGTPMPAFGQALATEPDTIWHLVHYVLSIVEGRQVEGLDEITVESVEAVATEE